MKKEIKLHFHWLIIEVFKCQIISFIGKVKHIQVLAFICIISNTSESKHYRVQVILYSKLIIDIKENINLKQYWNMHVERSSASNAEKIIDKNKKF